MRSDARKNYDQILAVAREVFAEQGADASLRDIARRADVGLGTLYRHFPTRESLLEVILRSSFDALTARATELAASGPSDEALVSWARETIAFTHNHQGVISAMVVAMDEPESALHASCVALRASGARLLARAQSEGTARTDIDGADLFALIAALAWLKDQPSHAARADHLFSVIADAILDKAAGKSEKP